MPLNIRGSGDDSLLRLMSVGDDPESHWNDAELTQMLRHQMAAALEPELALEPGRVAEMWVEQRLPGPSPATFLDLLRHRQPSPELLDRVRQFAKSNREHPDAPLRQIAAVLYRASILVARARAAQPISQLDDASILEGANWAISQSWVDPATRSIFEEAALQVTGKA